MPADPALHPAHVVAVRPDADGAQVKRSDYVLSVETPKGARNVLAPTDGTVELHVSLMQDVEPNTPLFSITKTAAADAPAEPEAETSAKPEVDAPAGPGEREAPERPSAAEISASVDTAERKTWLQRLFAFACIALAVVWPGFVFLAVGDAGVDAKTALITAALIALLLIPIWLLDKVPGLGGRSARGFMAFGALIAFVIALGGGTLSPQLRSAQESAVAPMFAPVKTFVLAQLNPVYEGKIDVSGANIENPKTALDHYATGLPRNGKLGEESVTQLSKAIELNPDFAEAYAARGMAYKELRKYKLAIADFDRAIELQPDFAIAYGDRGLVWGFLRDYDRELADLRKAISLYPALGFFAEDIALHYARRDNYDQAIKEITHAIDNSGTSAVTDTYREDLTKNRRRQNLRRRAVWYNQIARHELAVADATRALEINPKDSSAFTFRGVAHHALGRYDAAIADFTTGLKLSSDSPRNRFRRGESYSKKGEYNHAFVDFTKAIELDPRYAEAYAARANIHRIKSRFELALRDVKMALELKPKLAIAYRNRGSIFLDMSIVGKQKDEATYRQAALHNFNNAIELNPEDPIAYNNRGALYTHLDKWAKAIKDYNKAIELDPEYYPAYANRGSAYKEIGDSARAEADRKKYEELLAKQKKTASATQ